MPIQFSLFLFDHALLLYEIVVVPVFIGRCVDGCNGHGWCLVDNTCRPVAFIWISVFITRFL